MFYYPTLIRHVNIFLRQVETASYDPVFWFHHTFIDCIYEWFRQKQVEKGINPMRDWPAEYGDSAHSPFAAMRLGSLRMIDGTNNFFTERTLLCKDRPGTCKNNLECGIYMRCDPQTSRCVSDTLAVRTRNPDQINDLKSLLGRLNGLSSINTLINSVPARGFNQLFQTPSLSPFNLFEGSGSQRSGGSSGSAAANNLITGQWNQV